MVNYGDLLANERVGIVELNHANEFGDPTAWGLATLAAD
jgi:hypothetical protein